ncbi:MAG: hypothetical protein HY275_10750 [Gemmatimonadetes bacterium]|nr:hypothetical protein [Gemmatimonadota bacterium]
MRPHPDRYWAALVLVAGMAFAGMTAMSRPHPASRSASTDRPECPHNLGERYKNDTSVITLPASGELSVSGWQTNVPEFNDCQRFRLRDRAGALVTSASVGWSGYDSLFAIFAALNLDSVYTAAGPLPVAPARGAASSTGDAARLVVDGGHGSWETGIVVGVILAEGPYDPLGVKRGLNCIVLRAPAPGAYEGWVVPVGKSDAPCRKRFEVAAPSARKLDARPITAVPASRMPAVARWDWDGPQAKQFIGIKCPSGWCELTDKAPSPPRPAYDVPGGYPAGWALVARGRGFYDEQLLATYRMAAPYGAMVSSMWGTVFPHPDLGTYTLAGWERGKWIDVAAIAMQLPDDGYKSKLGVKPQTARVPIVTGPLATPIIQFCTDSAAAMGGGSPSTRRARCNPTFKPHLAAECKSQWYARVGNAEAGTWTYMCVTYRGMTGTGGLPSAHLVPPVVRWRWHPTDETIWVRCPTGCCEVIVERQ